MNRGADQPVVGYCITWEDGPSAGPAQPCATWAPVSDERQIDRGAVLPLKLRWLSDIFAVFEVHTIDRVVSDEDGWATCGPEEFCALVAARYGA